MRTQQTRLPLALSLAFTIPPSFSLALPLRALFLSFSLSLPVFSLLAHVFSSFVLSRFEFLSVIFASK